MALAARWAKIRKDKIQKQNQTHDEQLTSSVLIDYLLKFINLKFDKISLGVLGEKVICTVVAIGQCKHET